MIPKPYIARWKDQAPWKTNEQVEQDLVISRALVEIYSDHFLRENLAFRGGTALHKLFLSPAPRYSEDIDLVQIQEGPIKPVLKKIDDVIKFFELPRVIKQKAHNNTIIYRFISEYLTIRLRLKLEINCREHFHVCDWFFVSYQMKNGWYTGEAGIRTYDIHELLGTKLRALYQRKKGRDLFDLFYACRNKELDLEKIVYCFQKYISFSGGKPPTQKQFLQNMEKKKTDPAFAGDIEGLLRTEIEYQQTEAFIWLEENILSLL